MPSGRGAYDDEHRIFVQGMMCKGILNTNEVNELHRKALTLCQIEVPDKKTERQSLLVRNIQIINEQLDLVGLTIRKGVDEDTGENYFMLANVPSRMIGASKDLGTNVQVQWSSQELEYLRLLATEILQSEDKIISGREALHLTYQVGANGGKKMSMEDAEITINRLMDTKWIKAVDNNQNIALDVRFLGEMESWMIEVVGGVSKCQICRRIVVRGVYCRCKDGIGWHNYCLARQTKKNLDTKCKECGDLVQGSQSNGVVEDDEPEQSQTQTQKRSRKRSGEVNPTPSRRGRIRSKPDDDDESD